MPGTAQIRWSARWRPCGLFGLAYIHFAMSERGWFELTCLSQESPADDLHGNADDTVPPPHHILLAALDEMVRDDALTPGRRVDAEWSCWSTIHGFAELVTYGPLQGQDRNVSDELAGQVVGTIIDGLRT